MLLSGCALHSAWGRDTGKCCNLKQNLVLLASRITLPPGEHGRMREIKRTRQSWVKHASLVFIQVVIVLATVAIMLRFGNDTLARPTLIGDDEGYVLLTLKHYFAGEHLYSQVFTQYGPFYFFVQKSIFSLLHLPVTFDAGRMVFYGYWVSASLLGGLFVFRVSKNVTLASASALTVMWLLRAMAFEPNHPEQMVILLLMGACVAAIKPDRTALFILGAIGTALLFTKINVGVFFLLAVWIASASLLPAGRLRNISCGFLAGMIATGPIVLMHHFLSGWARGFCLIAIIAGLSVILAVVRANPDFPNDGKTLRYVVLGALVAASLVLLATKVEGMSFDTLWNGVVVEPLRLPEVFTIAFAVNRKMALVFILLSACVARLCWVRERAQYAGWIDALKCVAALVVIGLFVKRGVSPSGSRSFTFALMYSFLPLVLLHSRIAGWQTSDYFLRVFVTALAATQMLQAYPVAGSQVNVGGTPFLLWAFVCMYDGSEGLIDLSFAAKKRHFPMSAASAIGVFVFLVVVFAMWRPGMLRKSYPFPASALSGSSSLHLPPQLEGQYQALAKDLRANCDILFTMPGMGSFNFWSGVRTPDGFNMTAWMRGVPLSEQQQTLQGLHSDPSACVLVRPSLVSGWGAPRGGLETLPLAQYILHQMPIVFADWGYEIHVSPDRRQPWVEQASAAKQ